MGRTSGVRYGAVFTISLLLSWTLVTALLVLGYRGSSQSFGDAAQWVGFWFFTVGAPTVQALRIHRCLNEVVRQCPILSPQAHRDLAHARFVILMCGSMCVLLVFGLLVGSIK